MLNQVFTLPSMPERFLLCVDIQTQSDEVVVGSFAVFLEDGTRDRMFYGIRKGGIPRKVVLCPFNELPNLVRAKSFPKFKPSRQPIF